MTMLPFVCDVCHQATDTVYVEAPGDVSFSSATPPVEYPSLCRACQAKLDSGNFVLEGKLGGGWFILQVRYAAPD